MFDAYNVKKVLPRLVVAVILIQLSWFIFTALIRLTAVVAYGLEGLMYAPFGGRDAISFSNIISNSGVSGGNGLFVSAVVIGSAFAVVLGVVFSFALTALIGLLIGFATLLIRQVVLITLLVLSPLALVAWILPGTQKFWKIWWESFSKLLLMFPMIVVLIAGGRIVAYIAAQASGVDPATSDLFSDSLVGDITFLAIITIGYFGPFFLIPKTFQLAGSAFGNITGMVNDRSRGVFDRLRKGRQERSADRIKRAGSNSLWDKNSAIGKRANTAASWMVAPGSNLAYSLRNTGLPLSKRGRRIAHHIEKDSIEQTQKLFQEMNASGANDKTYRLLGGMHSGLSAGVTRDLRAAGLYGKELKTEADINRAAAIMGRSDNATEQLSAGALHGMSSRISSLYTDADMNKASVSGAAAIGLAAHGFADGEDLAHVANSMLSSGMDRAQVQTIMGQAQLAGAKSRPDIKNGYGLVYDKENKKFVDGMSEAGGRAESLLKTIGQGDIVQAKGGFLKKMGGTIAKVIQDGGKPENVAALNRVQLMRKQGMSEAQIAEMRDVKGNSIKDMADKVGFANSMSEELMLAASRYSSSPVDTKNQAADLINQLGMRGEFLAHEQQAAEAQARNAGAPPTGGAAGDGGGGTAGPAATGGE